MIGRQKEIKRLTNLLNSEKSEFLAITGRRRVGKTFLVDSVFKAHYCFHVTGIQDGPMQEQLLNFKLKLDEYQGTNSDTPPKTWFEAFQMLKDWLKTLDSNQKHVLFIDELPWAATPRSGFIQKLAHLWNDYLSKESHFILVICGSATSWITHNIINDKGGLHNRITERIHLQPFTLAESDAFFRKKGIRFTPVELTRIYMSLGGIPYYLDDIIKGESFPVAIERLCFQPTGRLHKEYDNLYRSLFKNPDLHEAIVATLAAHPQGLTRTQILKQAGLPPGGSHQRALKDLAASDFIQENPPYGKKKRGTRYRLTDEYSVFYHRFIKPNPRYTKGMWQQLAEGQSYKTWAGYAFETLCQKHVDEIKRVLGIESVYTEISTLNVQADDAQQGFQVDLILDRKDNSVNLIEMKFHATPYKIDKAEYYKLLERKQLFRDYTKTKKQLFITYITPHGLASGPWRQEVVDSEMTIEEILKS